MSVLDGGIKAFEVGNYSEAYSILIVLAEMGDAQAQCYIASMYQLGLGVPVNGKKAVEWYIKAAKQEITEGFISAIAYNNLATIYIVDTPGILPDHELAKKYQQKAKELGF
jgi:TPR repeat protein